ncbi:unnamed protein product [Rhizoctonia solani]|uniref:Dyp-type peroxidase n=1 Tax=Rhizoctonia solani TaxID=456999 RepID=A0A8H2XD86_9AGAM|nr:unnamed protein product [Rhizoctonia solani]
MILAAIPGTPLNNPPGQQEVDTTNVQGDVYPGFPKKKEDFILFQISDSAKFKQALPKLKVTTTADVFKHRQDIKEAKARQSNSLISMSLLNVAFSRKGINKLGITQLINPYEALDPFETSQLAMARRLGDPGTYESSGFQPHWEEVFKNAIDGVFIVAGESPKSVNNQITYVKELFGDAIQEVYRLSGSLRPGSQQARARTLRMFTRRDGISNPALQNVPGSQPSLPGQREVLPGLILCGHEGDLVSHRPEWTYEGSYLAFRKLEQLVPEFHKFLADNPIPEIPDRKHGSQLRGARLFGRWPSGAPTKLAPTEDDPKLGGDPLRNNKFNFPSDQGDSGQSACPYSAHIRKTNPRNDIREFMVKRSTIIRAGIPYGPELTEYEKENHITTESRGLAFVCYQSSLSRGFQLVQEVWQAWANEPRFTGNRGIVPGFDPIIGQNHGGKRDTMATSGGPQLVLPRDYVISRGGEYFFVPSIKALKTILAGAPAP